MRFCDRFVLLSNGCINAAGGGEVIIPKTIHEVFHIDADVHEIDAILVVVPRADAQLLNSFSESK